MGRSAHEAPLSKLSAQQRLHGLWEIAPRAADSLHHSSRKIAAVVKATLRSKPPTRSEIDNLGVVGACLNPPEQAIVLCVAEKSQSQALD